MKRLSLFALLATLCISTSFAAPKCKNKTPIRQGWDQQLPLHGDVESLAFTHYSAAQIESGKPLSELSGKTIFSYKFNRRGNVTEEILYNIDGSIDEKNLYKYNSRRLLAEKTIHNSNDSIQERVLYKYGRKRRVIERIWCDKEYNVKRRCLHSYDSKGHEIERVMSNADGKTIEKHIFKYNEQWQKCEKEIYNSRGAIGKKELYKYDERGALVEKLTVNNKGKQLEKEQYKYDSEGRLILLSNYNKWAKLCARMQFKYDEMGNLIEISGRKEGRTPPIGLIKGEIVKIQFLRLQNFDRGTNFDAEAVLTTFTLGFLGNISGDASVTENCLGQCVGQIGVAIIGEHFTGSILCFRKQPIHGVAFRIKVDCFIIVQSGHVQPVVHASQINLIQKGFHLLGCHFQDRFVVVHFISSIIKDQGCPGWNTTGQR